MNFRHLLFAMMALCGLLVASTAHAQFDPCFINGGTQWMHSTTVSRPVFRTIMTLQGNTAYTIETRNNSSGSDPVMRLVNSTGTQLAVDDDSGTGANARINYTPSSTMTAIIYVHGTYSMPYGISNEGTADLYVNSAPFSMGFAFSGKRALFCSTGGTGELRTVFEQLGPARHKMLVINGSSGTGGTVRKWAFPSTWFAGRYTVESAYDDFYVVLGSPDTVSTGDVSAVYNDTTDTDADGLGNGLEDYLGTCRTTIYLSPPEYCLISNPKDTDNDGIPDGHEFFGVDGQIPFRLWGADPLQKDVFAEVDWNPSGGFDLTGFDQAMANDVATYFIDENATSLSNPSGSPGIRVHFDVLGATTMISPYQFSPPFRELRWRELGVGEKVG